MWRRKSGEIQLKCSSLIGRIRVVLQSKGNLKNERYRALVGNFNLNGSEYTDYHPLTQQN